MIFIINYLNFGSTSQHKHNINSDTSNRHHRDVCKPGHNEPTITLPPNKVWKDYSQLSTVVKLQIGRHLKLTVGHVQTRIPPQKNTQPFTSYIFFPSSASLGAANGLPQRLPRAAQLQHHVEAVAGNDSGGSRAEAAQGRQARGVGVEDGDLTGPS